MNHEAQVRSAASPPRGFECACGREERARPQAAGSSGTLDVAAVLGRGGDLGETADRRFARATAPRAFSFPADHGPHDGFRTEWWYVTGTLFDSERRAFGFQLTFFRNAVAPPATDSSEKGAVPASTRSATPIGAAEHVWMAHLAVSDEAGNRFRFAERFAREALGMAGAGSAAGAGAAVHLRDWRFESSGAHRIVARESLETGELALDLEFEPTRPPLLQGDAGLSLKGPEPGNASYYYSMPRLATRGALTIDGERFEVSGLSWLDREWSTSALGTGVVGWDWFALDLDDGRDLMFYRLRHVDGASDPFSAGSLVAGGRIDLPIVRRRTSSFRPNRGSRLPTAQAATLRPGDSASRAPAWIFA